MEVAQGSGREKGFWRGDGRDATGFVHAECICGLSI